MNKTNAILIHIHAALKNAYAAINYYYRVSLNKVVLSDTICKFTVI